MERQQYNHLHHEMMTEPGIEPSGGSFWSLTLLTGFFYLSLKLDLKEDSTVPLSLNRVFVHFQFYQNRVKPSLTIDKNHWSWFKSYPCFSVIMRTWGYHFAFLSLSSSNGVQKHSLLALMSSVFWSKLDRRGLFLPSYTASWTAHMGACIVLVYSNLSFLPGFSSCCSLWGLLSSFPASRGHFGLVEEDTVCLCCCFSSWDLFFPLLEHRS